jgi:hypothetical protein
MPEPLQRTNQAIDADPSVYIATVGSEFFITGTIRDWDISDRLDEISVPTLIISGRHDELPPSLAEAIHRHVRGSELVIFEDASHMVHLEEPEQFLKSVEEFLTRIETTTATANATTGGTTMKTEAASIEATQGAALIDALRRRDLDDVRDLLAPNIHVRGLLPGQTTEADDRDAALAMFAEGFVNEAMERLDVVATDRIGDREFVAYRGQWSMPGHGTNVFEQHAFYDTDSDGRISWMHLVCSGNHPVSPV